MGQGRLSVAAVSVVRRDMRAALPGGNALDGDSVGLDFQLEGIAVANRGVDLSLDHDAAHVSWRGNTVCGHREDERSANFGRDTKV